MTRTRAKICGIRSEEALEACIVGGADAIGLVFHPGSPRHIDPVHAAEIARAASPFMTVVGLFVDVPEETVLEMARRCRLNAIQLHGGEPPDYCDRIRRWYPVIKAFRLKDHESVLPMVPYRGHVDAFLVDAYVEGQQGGTGQAFDWSLVWHVRVQALEPLILAGGLTPENVSSAVFRTKPYAVDVSSGVESEVGVKDPERIRQFLANLQGAS